MDNQLPTVDEQIQTRLQNALHNVMAEIASQGTDASTVSGHYDVTIVNGQVSVNKVDEAVTRRKSAPVDTSA